MKRLLILLLSVTLVFVNGVEANDDIIYISDYEGKEITNSIFYIGEENIRFMCVFGNYSHNYSYEIRSLLFLRQEEPCIYNEYVRAGHRSGTSLTLNPYIPVGSYHIISFLNYTDDNEQRISRQFNFTVELKKAMEIKNVKIPEGGERTISVEIETYIEFEELIVEFNTDGDIGLEHEIVSREDVEPGLYTFKTSIYKKDTLIADEQELGYRVSGYFDSRIVFFNDNWTMPANIDWTVTEDIESTIKDNPGKAFVWISGIILIISVITVYLRKYLQHKKKSNKNR